MVENLHRADLNPLEEAAAYQQLLEDFELTQATLATRVGKSRSAISNLLRLFQLPGSIQKLVMDGRSGRRATPVRCWGRRIGSSRSGWRSARCVKG